MSDNDKLKEITETYYTAKQVAEMLGYSLGRIYQLINAGKLKSYKPMRKIIIPHSSVMELLGEKRGDENVRNKKD